MPTFSSNDTYNIINELALASAEVNRLRRDLLLTRNELDLTQKILRPQQGEELLLTPEQLDSHLQTIPNPEFAIPDVGIIIPRYTLSEDAIRYNTMIAILEKSTQLHSFQIFILLSQTDLVTTDTDITWRK